MTPEQLDLAVWPIFYAMSRRGIEVGTGALKKLLAGVQGGMSEQMDQIKLRAEIDPASPKSISEWMKKEGLTGKHTRTGQMSTNERDLVGYNNPVLNAVVLWRGLAKLEGTFIQPILDRVVETGSNIVHPKWRLTRVKSGRVSCEDPNLLAFPSRDEMGKEVRKCFVAREGYSFVSVDFSQLEPRLVAAISGDPKLIEIFATGRDLYSEIAAALGVPRQAAKIVTLGVLYGMGAKRLMEQLALAGIVKTEQECEAIIHAWFDAYPAVKALVRDVIRVAKGQGGWATTQERRRRFLPALFLTGDRWPNAKLREEAERQAFNHLIQGTGMEQLKRAMIRVRDVAYRDVHPTLAIHDEMIYEVPASQAPEIAERLGSIMSCEYGDVTLKTSFSVGQTWGSLK